MGSMTRKLKQIPPSLGTLVQRVRAATPRDMGAGCQAWALTDTGPYGNIVHKGWSIVLSKATNPCCCALDHEHWHLSCRLVPLGRGSTLDDWRELGSIVARLQRDTGALDPSPNPVIPAEETDPNAAHHWAWNSDGISCGALQMDIDVTRQIAGKLGNVTATPAG
jgi:hypothetical protein